MDNGKGAGADGIRPEALKRCGNGLNGVVLGFCNRALEEGDTPSQWSELNIIPVPKSGSLTNCDNYRGISMCSVVTSVDRTNMFAILLRRMASLTRYSNLSRVCMIRRQTTARVISPDGITELFRVLAGILQGDTLAPYLFIIIVDYILRKAFKDNDELGFTVTPGKGGRRSCHKALKVKDLDYADDLAAPADNIQGAQEMFRLIEDTSAEVNLYVNARKPSS